MDTIHGRGRLLHTVAALCGSASVCALLTACAGPSAHRDRPRHDAPRGETQRVAVGAAASMTLTPVTARVPGRVQVLRGPEVDAAVTSSLCETIEGSLGLRCAETPMPAPPRRADAVDAPALLARQRAAEDPLDALLLVVVARPLALGEDGRVMGAASELDAAAAVSIADLSRLPARARADALAHLGLHELGHLLGAAHLSDRNCLMRSDDDPAALRGAPLSPCPAEVPIFLRGLDRARRPGHGSLAAIRGALVRRRVDAAAELLDRTARERPLHPEVVAELALAWQTLSDPQIAAALWLRIPEALRASPDVAWDLARALSPSTPTRVFTALIDAMGDPEVAGETPRRARLRHKTLRRLQRRAREANRSSPVAGGTRARPADP